MSKTLHHYEVQGSKKQVKEEMWDTHKGKNGYPIMISGYWQYFLKTHCDMYVMNYFPEKNILNWHKIYLEEL